VNSKLKQQKLESIVEVSVAVSATERHRDMSMFIHHNDRQQYRQKETDRSMTHRETDSTTIGYNVCFVDVAAAATNDDDDDVMTND